LAGSSHVELFNKTLTNSTRFARNPAGPQPPTFASSSKGAI
jgi:hypothetical protein